MSKEFLTKKTENDETPKKEKKPNEKDNSKSKGLNYYVFANKNNSKFTLKHVTNFQEFKSNLPNTLNPSYTNDETYLDKIQLKERISNKNNLNKEFTLDFILEDLKNIFPLKDKKKFFKKKNKMLSDLFIFSNTLINDNNKELTIFNNIHNYCNGYWASCKIKEFCYDSEIIFPNNDNPIFYEIIRDEDFVESIRDFYYDIKGIGHFYGSKGNGKSIIFRSILFNYVYNEATRYFPFIFFDLKILNKLIKNGRKILKRFILHESYSLFKNIESANSFIEKINFKLKNVMDLVKNIIQNIKNEINEEKILFIIDSYSKKYDLNDNLKKIQKLISNNYLFIIYDCLIYSDSYIFYNNFDPNHNINFYIEDFFERYYYYPEIKTINSLKIGDKVPKDYCKIFGQNVNYYFEFEKRNIDFSIFVKEKKSEIKNEINDFLNSNKNCKKFLKQIYNIIENKEKIEYNDILSYIPINYIKIDIEGKPKGKYYETSYYEVQNREFYYLEYCFPLIKECIEETLFENNNLINMKDEKFLQLPAPVLGANFVIEMNNLFHKLITKKKFFNHEKKYFKDINSILENFSNVNGIQIYKKSDVIKFINNSMELKQLKKDIKFVNFNNYTLILIFQENFFEKAFDMLILIQKNKEKREFIMNLIQIECSDTFIIHEVILPLQIEFIKHKFSILFNINICESYVLYLSIYEFPKNFALKNKDKTFLYNIKEEKFVDFNNNEYNNFPILPAGAIIKNLDECIFLSEIEQKLQKIKGEVIKLQFIKNIYFPVEDKNNIYNNLEENQIYVIMKKNIFNYYYKLNNQKGFYEFKQLSNFEIQFNKIFLITINKDD